MYASKNNIREVNDMIYREFKGKKLSMLGFGAMRLPMLENGEVEYKVAPMNLDNSHPLASINNEFNAVFVTGNAVDDVMFYGKGAGPLPTGSAVLGDVIEISKLILR